MGEKRRREIGLAIIRALPKKIDTEDTLDAMAGVAGIMIYNSAAGAHDVADAYLRFRQMTLATISQLFERDKRKRKRKAAKRKATTKRKR